MNDEQKERMMQKDVAPSANLLNVLVRATDRQHNYHPTSLNYDSIPVFFFFFIPHFQFSFHRLRPFLLFITHDTLSLNNSQNPDFPPDPYEI